MIKWLGKKIREIRKEKGLSMRELARLSTVSSSTMSDIENERINPSIRSISGKVAPITPNKAYGGM